MEATEKEVDRVLTLLRNKIRERGFTQLEVQEALSWGRSYISQLLTKQKSLRVEQVLLILDVIGVEPLEFYSELYHFPQPLHGYRPYAYETARDDVKRIDLGALEEFQRHFEELRSLLRGLVWLLTEKGMIQMEELTAAVESCDNKPVIEGVSSDRGNGASNV